MAGVEKYYVADDSIVVGFEWEGPPSNHSLPLKEVRREDVQNPGLHGVVSDKRVLPGAKTTHLESEGPVHPSDIRIPLLVNCTSVHRIRVLVRACLWWNRFSGRLGRGGTPTDRIGEIPDRLYNILVQFEDGCCPVFSPGDEQPVPRQPDISNSSTRSAFETSRLVREFRGQGHGFHDTFLNPHEVRTLGGGWREREEIF